MEFIKACGIFGIFILFVSFALLVLGVLLFYLAKSRKPLAIFLVVALMPLMIGLLGTTMGYLEVEQQTGTTVAGKTEVIQLGKRQARYTSYLGLGASVILLSLGMAGFLAKGNTPQQLDT